MQPHATTHNQELDQIITQILTATVVSMNMARDQNAISQMMVVHSLCIDYGADSHEKHRQTMAKPLVHPERDQT